MAVKSVDKKRPGGVVAVSVTPCRSPGQPDPEALANLCSHFDHSGVDGVFVIGSSGDMPLLDAAQRRELVRAARSGLAPGTLLYAGVSALSLDETIRQSGAAAEEGADLAVVMVPMVFVFSQRELFEMFRRIADASPIPVLLYCHRRMPSLLEVDTVVRLAEHPNIAGIKDTSVDPEFGDAIVHRTKHLDFTILQGTERLVRRSLEAGFDGLMTAFAGVVPEWNIALWKAFVEERRSDLDASCDRLDRLAKLFEFVPTGRSFSHFTHMLKRMLQYRGWLESAEVMMPGFEPDPVFERAMFELLPSLEFPVAQSSKPSVGRTI